MWRILALALLICAGCADWQAVQETPKVPNPDFLIENSQNFFAEPNAAANPPASTKW